MKLNLTPPSLLYTNLKISKICLIIQRAAYSHFHPGPRKINSFSLTKILSPPHFTLSFPNFPPYSCTQKSNLLSFLKNYLFSSIFHPRSNPHDHYYEILSFKESNLMKPRNCKLKSCLLYLLNASHLPPFSKIIFM